MGKEYAQLDVIIRTIQFNTTKLIVMGAACTKTGKMVVLPAAAAGLRIPANVTGHSGDRDRFAHGHHAGVSFVL